ncbi:MAG: iron-containing alcohol dehydrogenase [Armatimonadota bacterium]
MLSFSLRSPHEVTFGSGTRVKVGGAAALLGQRPLLVTGLGAARRGLVAELEGYLAQAGLTVAIFDQVEAEPSVGTVERGVQAFVAARCDLVVAAGGGSALDVGKAIAALAGLPDSAQHYFSTGSEIPGPGHPIIALPTTSGTGAEVTPNSVLTDPQTREKASIRGRTLMPTVALVDPELTLSLPREQTAFSGLDALTHALEAYVSTGANVVSDALAEEATRRLAGSLRRACEQPDDLPAREDLALGSLLAGLALASARLGLVHGLAHPLGALYHLPHGRVCGWLLPAVMRFNLQTADTKYAALAAMIGLSAKAEALVAWVEELAHELGACGSWREAGLKEADFAQITAATVASGSSKHNPRPVTAEATQEFLEGLMGG